MTAKLAVVGGGKMGEALVTGLLAAGWAAAEELVVVEPVARRREELVDRFPGLGVSADVGWADGAVIAVKPADVEDACRALGAALTPRVLSIAAGVPLAKLEEWLGESVAVVRAMPNTPALVGCGAAAIAGGTAADDDVLAWAESILSAVGIVERVDEHLLDAVTGLSGSARPTSSSWPSRSSTPACSTACPVRWPGRSSSRPCSARPASWPSRVTSRRRSELR